jgi:hypothetical protein
MKEGKECLCALMQQTIMVMHGKAENSLPASVAAGPVAAQEAVSDTGMLSMPSLSGHDPRNHNGSGRSWKMLFITSVEVNRSTDGSGSNRRS